MEITSPSCALERDALEHFERAEALAQIVDGDGGGSEDAGWGDGCNPSDMGGLQARLDGRGAAQMRREPPLDGHDERA